MVLLTPIAVLAVHVDESDDAAELLYCSDDAKIANLDNRLQAYLDKPVLSISTDIVHIFGVDEGRVLVYVSKIEEGETDADA